MTAVSEAFADAFIAACKAGGAITEPKRDHPIWRRLSDKALEPARDHYRREKRGEKLKPMDAWTARYLAPWAYDHEPDFAAYANRIDTGEAWRLVWTPSCAAAIEAARAEKVAA